MLFCSFEAFLEKFTENFSFLSKNGYLSNEHRNTKKFVFLNMFEKGQIVRKIWICLNNCF